MIDVAECVSGDNCEAIICAEGELCTNQKFCVNVTAETGSHMIMLSERLDRSYI